MKASNGGDAVFVKPDRECICQLLIKAEFWDAGTSSGQWCSYNDQDGVAGRMQSVAMVLRFTRHTWEFVTLCSWSVFCFCLVSVLFLAGWFWRVGFSFFYRTEG